MKVGDDFDGVGIGDVFGGAGGFESGDVDAGVGEGGQQRCEVLGAKHGFVALDVDVDLCRVDLGDGVDAV